MTNGLVSSFSRCLHSLTHKDLISRNILKIPQAQFTTDGSVEPFTDRTHTKFYGYTFLFKSVISLVPFLFLSVSLFVADPALWFPSSARLSISCSLHLSAAAEPGPHHPACQSPLYTFNPSYPSPCKAASLPSPLPRSKQPPPQKRRDPPLTLTPTHVHFYTCAQRHSPSLLQTKHAHDGIQIRRYRCTYTAHTKTDTKANTAPLPYLRPGLHLSFTSFHHGAIE